MAEKQWFTLPNGRQVYRTPPDQTRSQGRSTTLAIPYFKRDTIELCQSQADGRWYDSLSALRATYKPSGNPQGEEYIELGNQEIRSEPEPRKKLEKAEVADIVDQAQAAIARGEVE
jgi:hypothetical protein